MAVVGGADPESVFELAEEHLGGSPGAKRKARDPSPWKPPRRLAQVRRHLPKEQSHVVVGFPGTTVRSEDRFSVEVLTEILGGHGGRLFAQVREAKGLAYAVTAVCVEGIEPGYVALYAATSPGQERRIVDAMVSEVLRLRSERPKAQEVRRVRRHLVGTRAVAAQRAVVRAADMAMGELYGLGPDVDELYPRRIGEIAANDVVEAARAYLDPSRMIVSCVGPGAESLDLLGPTRPRGT